MGLDTHLLLQAVDAVQDAPDLTGVTTALADELRDRFDLWHVSTCLLRAGSPSVTVLASWGIGDTVFTEGTEVSASITPAISRLLAEAAEGRPVHTVIGEAEDSLIDFLLRQQGVRQATLQTVHRDEQGLVFLVLGSASPDVLSRTPAAFFAGLAAGIRPRILELTHLST